jgi:hypothetical protein
VSVGAGLLGIILKYKNVLFIRMAKALHVNNKRFIQLKKASFVCVCVWGGGGGGEVLSYRKQGKFINLNKIK